MVALILGLADGPDARTTPPTRWPSRSGRPTASGSASAHLDRSSTARPSRRWTGGVDAVRAGRARGARPGARRDRTAPRPPRPRPAGVAAPHGRTMVPGRPRDDRLGRRGRRRHRRSIRSSSRSAASATGCSRRPGSSPSARTGEPAQAVHPPPRRRGPPGAVRLRDARRARLLRPPPHGDRGRAEGRPRHRRQPGRCPTSSWRSSSRTRRSSSAIPGIGRKLAERVIFELKEKVAAAGTAALAAGGRTGGRRDRGRRRPPGARLQPGRGPRGVAGRAPRPGHRRNSGGPGEGCAGRCCANDGLWRSLRGRLPGEAPGWTRHAASGVKSKRCRE